jgi:DNA modification methylase
MKIIDQEVKENYAIYNADCIDVVKEMPDCSVDYSIFSPPFADLYCYSNSDRDMGNCKNYQEFFIFFEYLAVELERVIRKGRLCSVHCTNIPAMKERDGYMGIKDFRGDIIRLFEKVGFIFASEVCIWKDPLIEATRTKSLGLMHKQLCKDSSMCRMGLPDYILTFRKKGENEIYIDNSEGLKTYAGSKEITIEGIKRSHMIWQSYASPVWFDIRQTFTLNRENARDVKDEKHICPLQLDTIERCITLWSRPGEVVLSPFAGIGSEGYKALEMGRRFIGIELKDTYYKCAVNNLARAQSNDVSLFDIHETS